MAIAKQIKVVLNSKNYSGIKSLTPLGLNRALSPSSLKSLKKSMNEHGFQSVITVIRTKSIDGVMQNYNVDGNHRLACAESLDIPFHYLLVAFDPEDDTKENICKLISILNSNAVRWTPSKYLDLYSNLNVKEYQIMKETLVETKLTLTDMQNIFLFGCGDAEVAAFKSGEMVFPDLEKSKKLKDVIVFVKGIVPNKAYVRRSLFKIMKQVEVKDYSRFVKAIAEAKKHLDKARGEVPENEAKCFAWLEKIHKQTFLELAKIV